MRSYGQYCSVAKALDVIGARWNLLIVRELVLRGPLRYTDLMAGLPGIATNLLSERLRDLEQAGVVTREAAPPPIATTVFDLTERGRQLDQIVRALGEWGVPLMVEPARDDEFRSDWLSFPVSLFFAREAPAGPPVAIELRTGDHPMTIETADGEVRTRAGAADEPDLVLTGEPQPILGLLSGYLEPAEARDRGVQVEGDLDILDRLRPQAAVTAR